MASKNFSVYSPHLFHLCCLHSLFSCKHTLFEVALIPLLPLLQLGSHPHLRHHGDTEPQSWESWHCYATTKLANLVTSHHVGVMLSATTLILKKKKINENKKWSVQTLFVKFYFDENVYYLDFQLAMNYTLYLIRELSTNKCRIIKLTY